MTANPVIDALGRKLRLGVIGGGPGSFIGIVHRGAAVLEEYYDVVAGVFSSNPVRSLNSATKLGIERGYGSAEEMILAEANREDRVDVIAIMTPNNSHYAIACLAIKHGFHIMCEKPLTNSVDEAMDLVQKVNKSDVECCVAYAYSGYPMVREAKAIVAAGELGDIRMVQCDYVQGHLAELTESERQGSNWHMDPDIAGPSLILGDIGTHCYHLASFVTGMVPNELSADITTVVPGRESDDYTGILTRYKNNARGSFFITQAAAGADHGLYLRVYGSKGGLEWHQEQPNQLLVRSLDQPNKVLQKGGVGLHKAANRVSRIAIGHPEGYREAFANLYTDLAEVIIAQKTNTKEDPLARYFPSIEEGAEGIKFVQAAVTSNEHNGRWVSLS
ncbi:Gfo/Idh/MocA family oxidoreductase [Marinomonas sp. 15G1-11]|uniref:Gfo/Idh/MocA family oxidoreductase n=1 Tax=Marinomonas phaeophyticola TaxID=3004091 RepID=A0ABT4JWI6_9GAMM|nr:Gfo/Idh/MocA family oxidoreductase [Marinomonas sp. 15G1-11]MCZ2722751.1 Gfo/Idh/MocA family oxidoreductase [Marinomonas sp. 15G1-11]